MNKMTKYLACFFMLICLACGTTTELKTGASYEVVELPDGSQVFLNQHSSLSYQEDFSPRTMDLNGEAFFIVNPGQSAFIVTTQHGDVRVLGTEFNVKTTANQVAVDVKQGVVELKTKYHNSKVKKGIKAIYKDGEQAVQQLKSNREYRKWLRSLRKEFKSIGRELKPILKDIGNEFEKAGKKIGNEFKN